MNWDHLRYFLQVARSGRLLHAAEKLGVEHTTVARRISQLEQQLGQTLFIRARQGYQLTESGRQLLIQAERMEDASVWIEQQIGNTDNGMKGLVRVAATEGYATSFLAQHLSNLAIQHTDLSIDLLAMPRLLNLSRREADILITIERPPQGALVITKLTDYALHLYATPDYLATHAPIAQINDLKNHTFISYIDDQLISPSLNYLHEVCQPERIALRSTSLSIQQQAALAGLGIAILPAFMAVQQPTLQVILPQQIRIMRTFWMLMPVEQQEVARTRLTWNFIKHVTQQHQALMLGQHQSINQKNPP
ncbi:MAG: LysR family transcriptional regulator [Pseudomonadota bacterium]|nr:LysR family transcriptional regulator [Pseudomonadota bacterium]